MGLGDLLFMSSFYLSILIAITAAVWIFSLKRKYNQKINTGFLIVFIFMSIISIYMSVIVILGGWPVAFPQVISIFQLTTLLILKAYLKRKNINGSERSMQR